MPRYADSVRHLVQSLLLAGLPGDRSLASHLARAGWKLSRRTVQRIRNDKPTAPHDPPAPAAAPRAVRARYPNHVWMLDLTEIPGFLRLFSFKLAVVLDVFSRVPLAAQVFVFEPSGRDVARLFATAARRFGSPRHAVSDQGPQFRSRAFLRTLRRHGVRHRYGAIGRSGSIALIERLFRTLKTLGRFHVAPPLLRGDLERRLALVLGYYIWLRPHRASTAPRPPRSCWVSSRPTSMPSHPLVVGPASVAASRRHSRSVISTPSGSCPTSSAKPRSRAASLPFAGRTLEVRRDRRNATARHASG